MRSLFISFISLLIGLAAAACGDSPSAPPDGAVDLRQQALAAGLSAASAEPVRPVENPYFLPKVELGHSLFFDPILSGPKDVACSTCHLPRLGFADGRQFPSGAGGEGLGLERSNPQPWPLRLMPRNSPTVFNVGLYGRFGTAPSVNALIFWGGNAFGLEDQVLNPITADNELRGLTYSKVHAIDSVLVRLRGVPGYVTAFADAYPAQAAQYGTDPLRLITPTTLRLALAAYLRELVTPRAPFDAFMLGDSAALDTEQQRGLALFIGKAGCVHCHSGSLLSDFDLHVIGARQAGIGRDTTPGDDLGWGEHGGVPYAFRTPPLRQVAETAPYFHAGTAETLEDVLAFKNAGLSEHDRVPASALDAAVKPLGLTADEMAALLAFLHSLTDRETTRGPLFQAPASIPSGLVIPQ